MAPRINGHALETLPLKEPNLIAEIVRVLQTTVKEEYPDDSRFVWRNEKMTGTVPCWVEKTANKRHDVLSRHDHGCVVTHPIERFPFSKPVNKGPSNWLILAQKPTTHAYGRQRFEIAKSHPVLHALWAARIHEALALGPLTLNGELIHSLGRARRCHLPTVVLPL